MLVHAYDMDALEAGWIGDQQPPSLGQDRVVGSVPGDAELFGDAGHGQVSADDPGQSPTQPDPGSWPAVRQRRRCPVATRGSNRRIGTGAR